MDTHAISPEMMQTMQTNLQQKQEANIIKDSIITNGINGTALQNETLISMVNVFSEEIDTGKVANQRQSGRCWIFAALNIFRHEISKRLNLNEDFELSQDYLMFWDKLEQSNYFLEAIIKTADEPLDGRLLAFLLETPQQDGGQWDMLVSLVQKYGVVPKQVMPETYQSGHSRELNSILDAKLRECAITLRNLNEEGKSAKALADTKTEMLSDIYTILAFSLGEPPKTFDFEYRDQAGNFHRENGLTPQTFFKKYAGYDLNNYVSIINAPTDDKPYGKTFTVKFLGNVVGGKPIRYLNVDMKTLKELAIKQLKDDETVWFGCDVARYADRRSGVLDPHLYDYETAFQTHFRFTKAERLDYKESFLTHAMVLTGVNLADGEPNRWKVENSWGEKAGDQGYFVMSDKWMDEYTYQVVVNKKYLTQELIDALDQEPIELEPWDPMGSLAMVH